ncbi:MAG: hypothetical protein HW414_1718 [Dehalococcoidia bacterium]|nr:hypothetical protein [Dehalococcoidia bacterium]
MARFLTTKETMSAIENIIKRAKDKLVLVSPYVKPSEDILGRLRDTERQDVQIILVVDDDILKPGKTERLQPLRQLKNLKLYLHEHLHAKCYYNEEQMVITSMNILESSEKNREMGILILKKDDNEIFEQAEEEVKSILNASKRFELGEQLEGSPRPPKRQAKEQIGFCIRCRTPLPHNPDKPYCPECFDIWNEYQDPNYPDRYCHTCGRDSPTTMLKPQCKSCYDRTRR